MRVPVASPVIPIVYVPVAVSPPRALQCDIVEVDRPQHVPTCNKADPPSDVTFAPNVALLVEIEVAVGDATVGAVPNDCWLPTE